MARVSLHVRDPGDVRLRVRAPGDARASLVPDAVVMRTGGADDYEALDNKPRIEGNVLVGDKRLAQLGITTDNLGLDDLVEDVTPISNIEIDSLFS